MNTPGINVRIWRGSGRTTAVLLAAGCVLAGLFAGCASPASSRTGNVAPQISGRQYRCVVVRDLVNGVPDAAKRNEVDEACGYFSDLIADELRISKVFEEVSRRPSEKEPRLEITGTITRFEKGNANVRAWIGFGAGSSFVEATIEAHDAQTRQSVARWNVDKSSWVLGGVAAAAQTPEYYMQAAAKAIAGSLKP